MQVKQKSKHKINTLLCISYIYIDIFLTHKAATRILESSEKPLEIFLIAGLYFLLFYLKVQHAGFS